MTKTQQVSHRPMSSPLVVTKRDEDQHATSSWSQPATPTNRDPNRDKILGRFNHLRTLEIYRRQDDVFGYAIHFLLSGALPVFQNLNFTSYREACLTCCPSSKVIKSDSNRFLALGGLHEDKLCDILKAMAPTNVETAHQSYSVSRASPIDLECCHLPTASVLTSKTDKSRSTQFWSTSPHFSRPHVKPK